MKIKKQTDINVTTEKGIIDWVRTIKEGEVLYASFPRKRAHSVRCGVGMFNNTLGYDRDIFVHFHYCWSKEVAVIVAESLDERELNKGTEHEQDWKEQIEAPYNR